MRQDRVTSGSPIKTLREAFKFRKLSSKKGESTATSNLSAKPLHSTSKGSPTKFKSPRKNRMTHSHNANRESAQRITLFKHDNVRVLHGSLTTTPTNLSDFQQCTTSLLAMGRMEIYEIKTNSSCSKYLTIGKDSNVVHPLLPRLRVTKAEFESQYYISFSNPERFWEIQFMDGDSASSQEFERVISGLCDFATMPREEDVYNENDSQGSETVDEDSIDELNYLLSDDEMEEDIEQNCNTSAVISTNDRVSVKSALIDSNTEFRKVMSAILPPLDEDLASSKWTLPSGPAPLLNVHNPPTKRQSLYIGKSEIPLDLSSLKYNNRRSFSGVSDYETLVSLKNLHLDE